MSPVAAEAGAGGDPELVFLLKSAANLDIAVELLDLGRRTAPRPTWSWPAR